MYAGEAKHSEHSIHPVDVMTERVTTFLTKFGLSIAIRADADEFLEGWFGSHVIAPFLTSSLYMLSSKVSNLAHPNGDNISDRIVYRFWYLCHSRRALPVPGGLVYSFPILLFTNISI